MGIVWVGSPVGEIDWREGVSPQMAHIARTSLDIACACERLTVMVEMAYRLRGIYVFYGSGAWLARLTGGSGVKPQTADIACTFWILHVHANG